MRNAVTLPTVATTRARLAAFGVTSTMADSTCGRGQNTDGASFRTSATSARLCTSTASAP